MALPGRISTGLIENLQKFNSSNMKQAANGPIAMIICLVMEIELLEAQFVSVNSQHSEEASTPIRHSGSIAGGPREHTASLSNV